LLQCIHTDKWTDLDTHDVFDCEIEHCLNQFVSIKTEILEGKAL